MKIARTDKGLIRHILSVCSAMPEIDQNFLKSVYEPIDKDGSQEQHIVFINYHILKTDKHKGHKGMFDYFKKEISHTDCAYMLDVKNYQFKFLKKKVFWLDQQTRYTFVYENGIDTMMLYVTTEDYTGWW